MKDIDKNEFTSEERKMILEFFNNMVFDEDWTPKELKIINNIKVKCKK